MDRRCMRCIRARCMRRSIWCIRIWWRRLRLGRRGGARLDCARRRSRSLAVVRYLTM